MSDQHPNTVSPFTRREAIKSGAALGASLLATPLVHAAGDDLGPGIKIGVIGCGGRGTGAMLDAMGVATKSIYPETGYHTEDVAEGATSAKRGIEVVALGDLFDDRLQRCRKNAARLKFEIPPERCHVGFDAYQKVLADQEVNYVILATPPHFRPQHLMAAIEAGKNVFMEKPGAVDVPGVRMVMEAGRLAKKKGLAIAAGTQRRHQKDYRETIARIHDGAIGRPLLGKAYWNGGQIWVAPRKSGWSDIEAQIRNWNYYTWLSGDHIVEQHVHNLDIMNWVFGTHPIRVVTGLGGRQVRKGEIQGHIYDHFAVEYEYPDGVSMFSQCRQINDCKSKVGEVIVGTNGTSDCCKLIEPRDGEKWRYRGRRESGYRLEHEHLMASILAGEPINEAQSIAESTMTAIIGREACYSGQQISWDEAMKSEMKLGPDKYEFADYPMPEVAMPGEYRFS